MLEIPKAYEPQAVEANWYQFWLDHKCFAADPARVTDERPAYSIVIPPPNITGVLHMGHVLNNTVQDILARKARMDGKEVLWLPGTDHASIATHMVMERKLKKEEHLTRHDLGREKFIERAWKWKEEYGGIIIQQLKKLGCSCDWTRERFTMDPEYSRCVERVFVDLYRKGFIYRGKRMVNWCPATLTALSDEEVIMKEQQGFLYYFKVEVADLGRTGAPPADSGLSPELPTIPAEASASGETPDAARGARALPAFLTIATTRPETIPGDTAVAVNPKDTRYAHLIGKHVVRPLPAELPCEQKLIPIIADQQVDFEFGTGVLKVTPAHDKADFGIGQRHHLPLREIMNPDGKMNERAGADLRGLDRFEARKVAVEKLRALGALVEEKPYQNSVGFSERADVPIEPRLSEQWFLKYPAVDQARGCLAQEAGSARVSRAGSGAPPGSTAPDAADETGAPGGQMRFHPQRWAKVYDHWMGNIQDWCISRQLWWGHRIPVWYNRLGWQALDKTIEVVRLAGDELPGRTARELRLAAWRVAETSGLLRQRFKNHDTGWDIYVHRRSLEHAFANEGMVNIKLVPALPQLLNNAIHITSEPHEPAIPQVVRVHKFLAALQLGAALYRVRFTVKELRDGRKLYDHQAVSVKANETDGKSPGTHPQTGKLVTRPASASRYKLAEITDDVKTDETFTRCQIESPGEGWHQETDVLDTWFSSWLWPFATMGWTGAKTQDSKNPTLQAFYPTTDLVTAPEIIFFWVARMIMAGYEFMGELPFRNVYFTGIIRDKQGRKMSKSLGNSPDPLDLIAKYGADAVRFGTMRSAPLGQDVLFDEKDVELGRNFCNKLWNACRFRQMVGSAGFPIEGEIDPALLTSDDKWILLRLDQAIREINAAFAEYRFNEVAQTLYRFFWSEYCDWYVEASKAVLGSARVSPAAPSGANAVGEAPAGPDSSRKAANALAVIDFVLSHALRLFHPFLPFITEELWHGMGYHQDLPADQGGQTIMVAHWPKPFDAAFKAHYGLDESDERFVNAKYELVGQGRNLRREANLAAGRKVKFVLKTARELSDHEVEVLKILLQAEALELDANYPLRKGTLTVRAELGDLYLPLEGLVDFAAERARLMKEMAKINAEIEKVQAKLNNPVFREKVPAAVLEEHQKRLADWQARQRHTQNALDGLGEG